MVKHSILPYAGSWADAGVAQRAQELNNPILAHMGASAASGSLLQLELATVVLSGLKAAQDGSGDTVVRVYETAGRSTQAVLTLPGARQVASCDLAENPGEMLAALGGVLRFGLRPFEIKSFRVERLT